MSGQCASGEQGTGSTEQGTHPHAQHYSRDGSWHSSKPRKVGDLGEIRLLPSTQAYGAEGSGTCRKGSEVMSSGRRPLSFLGLAACSPWLPTAWESFCLPHLALGCAHLHRAVPRPQGDPGLWEHPAGTTPCQATVSPLHGGRTTLTQTWGDHCPRLGQDRTLPCLATSHTAPSCYKASSPGALPCLPRMAFLWAIICLALASTVSGKPNAGQVSVSSCTGGRQVLGVQEMPVGTSLEPSRAPP